VKLELNELLEISESMFDVLTDSQAYSLEAARALLSQAYKKAGGRSSTVNANVEGSAKAMIQSHLRAVREQIKAP
jgi:hypothetical protein